MSETKNITKTVLTDEVRKFFKNAGMMGAQIHKISPAAGRLGVRVRKMKAELIKRGYEPIEALERARNFVSDKTPYLGDFAIEQLTERCHRLQRELTESRKALQAAEQRENDLIDRIRAGL